LKVAALLDKRRPEPRHDKGATMKVFATLAAITLSLAAGSALAATCDHSIDHRQAHQHARIAHGAVSGQLTARESARLRAEQRAIAAQERFYKRDGYLSPWERADLHRDLNYASRDIYWQRHDRQMR
jgi:hypothetical protein